MFLNGKRGYTATGQQWAKGPFLIVFQRDWIPGRERMPRELRCAVRTVLLRQVGHFMMGETLLCGERIGLSGEYGDDGLPMTCRSERIWHALVPLPRDLQEAFWKGGGCTGGGTEAAWLRTWAKQHLTELRRACRVGKEQS